MWTHTMTGPAAWWMWALMVLATAAFWLMVAVVVRLLLGGPAEPREHDGGPASGQLWSPGDGRPMHDPHLAGDDSSRPVAWRRSSLPGP